MKILHPQEVADMLGKSLKWVYIHAVELGAVRIGGLVDIYAGGLRRCLTERERSGEESSQ